MMNIKGIFAVSLIAMVAMVAGAHTSNAVAAIASQGYVDQQVGSKLSSISGSTTGSGNVVTVVSASGSTVSVTKGITAEETKNKVTSVRAVASATDTAYPSEKAVATALAGKEATSNKVTSANYAANVSNDTKYPTVKAVADNIHNATLTIKKNGESVGTFTANASVDKEIEIDVPAAGDILTTTTVTSSGTGAVLTGVSVTAGKVTLQKGNVQIPSGGQNATSYVSIWVE